MICGKCSQPLRRDDFAAVSQWEGVDGGTVTAPVCRDCLGQTAPTYPPGNQYYWKICGYCRKALRHGDEGKVIRVRKEDMDEGDTHPHNAYFCCRECVEHFKPRILARLGWTADRFEGDPVPG